MITRDRSWSQPQRTGHHFEKWSNRTLSKTKGNNTTDNHTQCLFLNKNVLVFREIWHYIVDKWVTNFTRLDTGHHFANARQQSFRDMCNVLTWLIHWNWNCNHKITAINSWTIYETGPWIKPLYSELMMHTIVHLDICTRSSNPVKSFRIYTIRNRREHCPNNPPFYPRQDSL